MKYRDEAFPNIPFSHAAYDVETKDLTHEEKGVYVDLLILFWRRKCEPIPDNDEKISRMISCTLDRWKRKLRPAIERLFIISEEGWRHERMEQRWAGIEEKSAVAAQKGRLGGRPPNHRAADTFPNPLTDRSEVISQTQNANPLENKETEKAAAFDQLKLNESYKIESKKEESKNPPLSPPMGGMGLDIQNGPPALPKTEQPALFAVQEVQHTPVRDASGPRRKRGQKVVYPQEIAETISAFKEAYPPRDAPHAWSPACEKISAALRSGVPAEDLIRAARNYAKYVENKGWTKTEKVADAKTWTNQKRWDEFKDFVPPKTYNGHHSNVTPLRNGTNGQPMPKQTRGGIQY